MSHRWTVPFVCLALCSACAVTDGSAQGQDGAKQSSGDKTPEPEPVPPVEAKLGISAVQMLQDCPDPVEPAAEAAAEPAGDEPPRASRTQPAKGASRIAGGDSFAPSCDQSTVQLALEIAGEREVKVAVSAVRLLSKRKQVGTLVSRKPSYWVDQGYQRWDEKLTPNEAVKASYKLSQPDWAAVEKAIGESSYGHTFTLEVDVEIEGRTQTVVSAEFPREQPHIVET